LHNLGAVLSRRIRTCGTRISLGAEVSPGSIRRISLSTAYLAIFCLSGATVVSVGVLYRPSSMSSKPTMARSSGTRSPRDSATRIAPSASRSL
jgi:hypothetical protein